MHDLVIRGARLIDGTGRPASLADIAVTGGLIAALGDVRGRARRTIDAPGLTVIPGVIDPHSHADLILPLAPERQRELMRCKLAQGITTTVIGNCGLGCAPVANAAAEAALRAVNAWMTPEPVAWPWRGVGDYLDHLERNGLALNVATLVPHGPVRISAMGLAKGRPSPAQARRMRGLVGRGLREGALGLSSGLIYPPGMYSDPEELTDLARLVADYGGVYASHIRGSSETLLPAVRELLEVARATGVRVHHSHNEAVGREHWPKVDRVLRLEERAARAGLRVSFDMFPYTAAATMMIAIYPPWALEGGVDELIARLRDAPTRARIRRDVERRRPTWPPWREAGWPHNLVRAAGWGGIEIGYVAGRRHKRYEGHSLAELGRLTGKAPFEAISDLIVEERGQVSMLIFEVTGEREERALLARYARHPLGAFCSDAEDYGRGKPHPAAYGAFPRVLARLVREDGALAIEEAVRKMTSYPAEIFGLHGRGVVRTGAHADLVILDPRRVADRAEFERPRRSPAGIRAVIVNGRIALEGGKLRPGMHGEVIRRI